MANNQSPKMPNLVWIEHKINLAEPEKCDHYFEFKANGCECKKCHMGLIGVFEIEDGIPVI